MENIDKLNRGKAMNTAKVFVLALCWGLFVSACAFGGEDSSVVDVSNGDSLQTTTTTNTETSTTVLPTTTSVPATTTSIITDAKMKSDDEAKSKQQYTETQLGLEAIVDNYLDALWGRPNINENHVWAHRVKLESGDAQMKRRGEFEEQVYFKFMETRGDEPIHKYLRPYASEGYLLCFFRMLDVKPTEENAKEIFSQTEEQQQAMFDELGWDQAKVDTVAQGCWTETLTFPTLEEGEGERLMKQQRAFYLKIARDWVEANPDKVVPLTTNE